MCVLLLKTVLQYVAKCVVCDNFGRTKDGPGCQGGYWEEELIPQLKTCIIQTLQAVEPNIVQRHQP